MVEALIVYFLDRECGSEVEKSSDGGEQTTEYIFYPSFCSYPCALRYGEGPSDLAFRLFQRPKANCAVVVIWGYVRIK